MKIFNFFMHFISYDYCQKCYTKMEDRGELEFFLLPYSKIQHYRMPEDKEFYKTNLTPVESEEAVPNSRHYVERKIRVCPKCGKYLVSYTAWLKVREKRALYGEVIFPYEEGL